LLPGQYYDQETGLHYNYFRYYDPSTGRYITSDPLGLDGGLNTFGYVGQNPLVFVDPKGLARKRLGQEYRPCDDEDLEACRIQCGSSGIKKCDRLWYFKPVRAKKQLIEYDWKPGPLSCVCNDNSNGHSCGVVCKFFILVGMGLLCIDPIPGDEMAAAAAAGAYAVSQ
jgi:RHS repeat-associated protein